MFDNQKTIEKYDAELWNAMQQEGQRQEQHIELIASENYTSPAVMEAQGSKLTNKYAEGYPNKRYYGGCEYVDVAEVLAIERLKSLYGADFANVQPHSGSQANAAVYMALMEPGETVLGMSLNQISSLLDQLLAYYLIAPGAVTYVYLANRLLLFPHALTAMSVAVAVFPTAVPPQRISMASVHSSLSTTGDTESVSAPLSAASEFDSET